MHYLNNGHLKFLLVKLLFFYQFKLLLFTICKSTLQTNHKQKNLVHYLCFILEMET
jgi:hypothetical protein